MKMKASLPLLLCRILIGILIISILVCFTFSIVDITSVDDLTDEEKNNFLSNEIFMESAFALSMLKEMNSNVHFNDITYIEHVTVYTNSGVKWSSRICIGMRDSEENVYLKLGTDCYIVSEEEYREGSKVTKLIFGKTAILGVQLKFIKEVADSSEYEDQLNEWNLHRLETYSIVKKVLNDHYDIWECAENITGITASIMQTGTVLGKDICYSAIKFEFGNGLETQYYVVWPTGASYSTDWDTYITYLSYDNQEEYTEAQIEMLIKELRGR